MITKEELKELLSVLNDYLLGGIIMGISCAAVAAFGGILFVKPDYALFVPARAITVIVMILIGATMGLLAYLVALPSELKLVRIKLKPKILARRLSRKK